MNKFWTILALLLIFACGDVDESGLYQSQPDAGSDTIAKVEQGLTARCADPNRYGTDQSVWGNPPCNRTKTTAECSFPDNQAFAFPVGLRNGWSSSERTLLGAYGLAANTFFHQTFSDWENLTRPFTWSNNINTGAVPPKVFIDKGPTGSSTALLFANYVHMACLSASSLTESYPMNTAKVCFTWAATVDYDKLKANVPSAQQGTAMVNIFQKIYSVGVGIGISTKPSCNYFATDAICPSQHSTDCYKSDLLGAASDCQWAHDYRLNTDFSNTLTCIL